MPDDKTVITEAANKYGIDPKILFGVYGTESNFGKDLSTSSAGAEGPFQFEPATARSMGINPHDFRSSAFGAAKYLSQYKSRGIGGMLSAYNAGPAGGYQADYVNKTLRNAQQYGSSPGSATFVPSPETRATEPRVDKTLQTLRSLWGSQAGPLNLVFNKLAQQPNVPSEPPTSPSKGYSNPLPGFTIGRTDMGVDATARPGTPIRAIGDGRVLGIEKNWYAGQPYLYYELTSGPMAGRVIYVAEQIDPQVKPGDLIKSGQTIARYAPRGTGIETGFGTKTWQTLAQREGRTGGPNRENAPAGQEFRKLFLK